jgi:hypothetical protein
MLAAGGWRRWRRGDVMQNEQRRPGGGGAAVDRWLTTHREDSPTDPLGQAALAYAGDGWSVFPCEPRGKTPLARLAPAGVKNATTDPDTVARWWRQEPDANIGLACGGNFWVLDLDPDKGAMAALADLERRYGPLPTTVSVITGSGGWHHYFAPNPRPLNWANRLGTKLDTRNTGGYVLAPPSVHPNGRRYEWAAAPCLPIVAAPAWLLDILDPPRAEPVLVPFVPASTRAACAYVARAFELELERVALSGEGERNDNLNLAAYSLGRLAGAGLLDPGEVAAALAGAALATGLDRREVEKTLRSGLRSGMASPREVRP